MTTEELKVKISVDYGEAHSKIGQIKRELKELGRNGQDGGHRAARGVNELKRSLHDVKTTDVASPMSRQMKKIKDDISATNKQALVLVSTLKNQLAEYKGPDLSYLWGSGATNQNSEELGNSAEKVATSFEDLRDTLEKIRNNQWADMFIENLDKIKAATADVRKHWQLAMSGFRNAGEEFFTGINPRNFDGIESFSDFWSGFKIQVKESVISMRGALANLGKAFRSLGTTIKAFVTSTIGQLALLVGAVVAWVAAIKNAISASRQLKEEFSEAMKIGLDLETYREWSFILESVGVGADKLSDFLKTLADEQNSVREGSEDMIQAFNKIGLSADEVANMGQGELFSRTVAGLQNVDSEVERTAIAYKIFGEDAAQLTSVIKLNNEQLEQMKHQFYALGGGVSQSFIQKSNQLQSSLHHLRTAWDGLKRTLAEGFMPLITKVVNGLTKAIVVINVFMKAVFGFEMISEGTSSDGGSLSSSLDSVGESADGARDKIDKLKRTTMGFDELNIVQNPNSSTVEEEEFTVPKGLEISPLADLVDIEKIKEKFSEWKDEIRALVPLAMVGVGAVGAVLFALSGNWIGAIACAALAGFGLVAMTGGEGGFQGYIDDFNTALDGLLAPCTVAVGAIGMVIFALMGNWVGAIACAALCGLGLYAMSKDEGGISGAIDRLNEKTQGLVGPCTTAVGAIGMVIGALMMNIPIILAGAALCGVGVYMTNKDQSDEKESKFNTKIRNIINTAMLGIGVLGCVVCILTGNIPGAIAFGAMAGVGLYNLGADNGWWETIGNKLKDWWDGIKTWFNEKVKPVFTKEYWLEKWNNIKKGAKIKLEEIRADINGWWNDKIVKWFNEKVKPKFTKEYWSNKFNSIKEGISAKLSEIKTNISNWWNEKIVGWFNSKVKVKFTKEYWAGKFNSIKEGAKSAFNGVIATVEKAINKIIKQINKLSWDIPDWVPVVGGEKFGFNFKEVSIPRLATGGIVTQSTLANIGEAGREAVLPLDSNTEWMDRLADKIANRNSTPTKVVLTIDGKELGYATIDSFNKIYKQTGTLPLVVM